MYSAGSLEPTTFVWTMAWTGPSLVVDGWSCTSVKPDGGVTSGGSATTSSAARSRSSSSCAPLLLCADLVEELVVSVDLLPRDDVDAEVELAWP
ncbi:hypothetical protein BE20_25635 [Sorangium cellulosum]|nr:hypothetical protein BE20_25635 [Sorangium cellulosum]